MSDYSKALAAYLAPDDRTQDALAESIKSTQAAISRYATGARFPNAETARAIHDATGGEVSFELWQQIAAARFLGSEAA